MEQAPLLESENESESASSHALEQHGQNYQRPVENRSLPSFFFCIFAFAFCIEFGVNLLELPMIRLVELMVCRRYIDTDPTHVDEEACKIPVVQNEVAFIIGYKTTLDALPCLLTVLFYGHLSDSWGRRFLIMLQISGRLLALTWIVLVGFLGNNVSPKLIWISSLFLFIGGSRKAQVSTVYASFCDIVSGDKRIRLLALVHAAEGFAGLFSYPISSMLMAYRLWTPFALAVVVNIVEYVVLCATPETSPFLTTKQRAHRTRSSTQQHRSSAMENFREALVPQIRRSSLWLVFKHRGLNVIFASFFVKRLAFAGEDFVPQYASEILHRRIFETFWLQVSSHVGMLLTLSIVVPFLTRHMKSPLKDLWVIRGSLVSIVLGFFVLWRGRRIPIFCLGLLACGLGEGVDVGIQSLGSYIVGEAHHGTFFPLSSLLGVAGELIGGPLMAALLTIRDQRGQPLGYCFLLSSMLFTCLLMGSRFINTSRLSE